jgi:ornithine cyclodeaminase/alanine dehydrogenase-like protein (mu-crystallin family)
MIPFFSGAQVREAVSPERALEAVRDAIIAYARGEWTMPHIRKATSARCRLLVPDTHCSSG